MKRQAIQRLLSLTPYQPGKPIDDVKRELGLKKVIKLASNESPLPPSPKVLKAIEKAALEVNRYPDGGCFYLRQELSKRLSVQGNQLIFGNGSDEIIIMALRAFVNPDDEILVSDPSFMVYSIGGKAVGAKVSVIPMKNFQHDLDAIASAVNEKTKMIFLDNPGNPSGTYISDEALRVFLNNLPKRVVVFLDEAYYEYASFKKDFPCSLSWFAQYPNVIIARTFSKIYGLAGLRVGYAIANEEMIDILNRVREPFNVNSLAQAAAVAALKDEAYYQKRLREFRRDRDLVSKKCEDLGVRVIPGVTNFVLLDMGTPGGPVAQALLKKGLIVRDMTVWGLKNFIRVTIGTKAENKSFIQAFKSILKK